MINWDIRSQDLADFKIHRVLLLERDSTFKINLANFPISPGNVTISRESRSENNIKIAVDTFRAAETYVTTD